MRYGNKVRNNRKRFRRVKYVKPQVKSFETDPYIVNPIGNVKNDVKIGDLEKTFKSLKNKSRLTNDIIKLFPDITLSMRLMSKLIRKPNGNLNTYINVRSPNKLLPSTIRAQINNQIEEYVKSNYKIEKKLATIVENTLFKHGSHVEIILPDEALHKTVEKLTKPMKSDKYKIKDDNIVGFEQREGESDMDHLRRIGVLGLTYEEEQAEKAEYRYNHELDYKVGYERAIKLYNSQTDYLVDEYVGIVNKQLLIENIKYIGTLNKVGAESKVDTRKELMKNIFRATETSASLVEFDNDIDFVNSGNRDLGKPLTLTVDPDAVIPVCSRTNPSDHIGYFCMVDENGVIINNHKPVTSEKMEDLSKLNKLFNIREDNNDVDKLYELYHSKLEQGVISYLNTTKIAGLMDNSKLNRLKELSFNRALGGLKTKLVYFEASQVVYYAVDYRSDGTGKSVLEDLQTLVSLRAMLMFAKVNGTIKNSISRMKANITLDPKDPNPTASMEKALAALMESKMDDMPINVLSVNDLTTWLHRAGIQANVKHPSLPDIDISIEESSGNAHIPDDELQENIGDLIIRGMGLVPELIKSASDIDFAVVVKGLNSIMTDVIIDRQDKFNAKLTKHYKLLTTYDNELNKNIHKILLENFGYIRSKLPRHMRDNMTASKMSKEEIVDALKYVVIEDIEVTLPEPIIDTEDTTVENFNNHSEKLDDAIEYYLSSDFIPDEYNQTTVEDIDNLKELIKGALMRKWMDDNNYLPDLSRVFNLDIHNEPDLDILSDYTEYLKTIGKIVKPFDKELKKLKKSIERAKAGGDEENPDDTGDTGEGTPDTGEDTGGTGEDTGGTGEDDTGDADVNDALYGGESYKFSLPDKVGGESEGTYLERKKRKEEKEAQEMERRKRKKEKEDAANAEAVKEEMMMLNYFAAHEHFSKKDMRHPDHTFYKGPKPTSKQILDWQHLRCDKEYVEKYRSNEKPI